MKKRYLVTGLGMFSGLMLSTALIAGEGTMTEFSSLDTNQDGSLSAEEAATYQELSKNWSKVDADENGMIDQVEFSAFEAMQETGGIEAPIAQ
jgi:Ca2+-binding EF-hand superfamily protein